jgi:hypothetical protein
MLRSVAGTLGAAVPAAFRPRDRREELLESVRLSAPLGVGFLVERFFFVLDLTVADEAWVAPAASRVVPGRERQINIAASRNHILLRFILLCSERCLPIELSAVMTPAIRL